MSRFDLPREMSRTYESIKNVANQFSWIYSLLLLLLLFIFMNL